MRSVRLSDSLRKNQLWNGLVTITLLEGKDIPGGGLAEIFILLKLGDQRYKSKVSIKDFLKFAEANTELRVSFTGVANSDGTILESLLYK